LFLEQFDTRAIHWSPDGKGLVLLDRETFCCAFEVEGASNDAGDEIETPLEQSSISDGG